MKNVFFVTAKSYAKKCKNASAVLQSYILYSYINLIETLLKVCDVWLQSDQNFNCY